MMEDRSGYVRVINNTDLPKPIVGRYAGKDYVFKKGVPVDVPEIVAAHVFDFGKEDKSQALLRLGWAQTSEELEAGMARMFQVAFEDPPEMIEAPKPARGKKSAGKETGTAGPPVNASGTEGGDLKSPPSGPKIGQEDGDGDGDF